MKYQVKLSIKIDNKNPIELNELTLSLNALASQYDSFLRKSENFDYHKSQRKLYISKIESDREGRSLSVDLVPDAVRSSNSLIEFGYYLKNCYDYFIAR